MKKTIKLFLVLFAIMLVSTLGVGVKAYAASNYSSGSYIYEAGDLEVKLWAKFSYDGKSASYYDSNYRSISKTEGFNLYVSTRRNGNTIIFTITETNKKYSDIEYKHLVTATCDKYGTVSWEEESYI